MTSSERAAVGLAAGILCFGCASIPAPPERLESWMARSSSAWTAMKDDGQPVPSLDRPFVQTGMSSASSIVFVVIAGAEPWSLKSVEAIGKGVLSSAEYQVAEQAVGGSKRVELSGLPAAQRFRVTFAFGDAVEVAESRTAPAQPETTSVLLVSCNEPWNHARPDRQTVGVSVASANALRTLELRATGQLPIELSRRGGGPVRFERSSFLIGLGDQAYVDAEPGEAGSLSLFSGPRSNDLRVAISEPAQFGELLARIYRMHFLIPTFHRALSSLPSAMVWDDHEIRDGWGSQRDEAGLLPSTQQPWTQYFAAARKLTWEFEVARNPNAGGAAITGFDERLDRELDTTFTWGDRVRVFLLDTRTVRGRPEGAVISDAQVDRVEAWFKPCGASPSVFLLGVPVPLSVNHDNQVSKVGATLSSELDDDIHDGWWALTNAQNTRMRLETLIVDHVARCADDRILLVSGDVHESGLVAITRENKTIAYEVISSGIASMALNGALSRALEAARGDYFAISQTGVSYSGVGRISKGSSFAEVFFEFPENAPPKIRALFYPTTEVEPLLDNTLINVGSALKGTLWQTGTTGVGQLASGTALTTEAVAIELDYGIRPPPTGEYSLSQASTRCTTDLGLFSWGVKIDDLATDWSTLLEAPRACRDVR